MAYVVSVNISDKKGQMKKPIEKGYFEVNFGLVGDAHAGSFNRQVSLLANESIDKFNKMHPESQEPITYGQFAENITTQGIELYTLPIGTKLKIGQVELEITQIGKKCHEFCEIKSIAGDCIMPREGIFTKVLTPGWIKPGDEIEIIS